VRAKVGRSAIERRSQAMASGSRRVDRRAVGHQPRRLGQRSDGALVLTRLE
jgi:hypothetical protein